MDLLCLAPRIIGIECRLIMEPYNCPPFTASGLGPGMEQRKWVFICMRQISSLLLDSCPCWQENILSVCHNVISFMTINKLTFWIFCPAVVKLFHPSLHSYKMNSLHESTPSLHFQCIEEVNKNHRC